MQGLHSLTLAALTAFTIALYLPPPTSLAPTNSTTTHSQPSSTLNLTATKTWPPLPCSYPITASTSFRIVEYGRHLCAPRNAACELQLARNIHELSWIARREYSPGAQHAYSFTSGPAYFYFKQEVEVQVEVVLGVLNKMATLMVQLGITEILGAGVVIENEVVGRWMLTFPGI